MPRCETSFRKPVDEISDRAKRYRANRCKKKAKFCENCGSRKNLVIGHRDGNESNNRPYNLGTFCKSCNTRDGKRDVKMGRGVRTRQYNPSTKLRIAIKAYDDALWILGQHRATGSPSKTIEKAERRVKDAKRWLESAETEEVRELQRKNPGANNLAQYVQAAMDHVRGAHDAGGQVLHETPKSKRREFAREIWFRRGYRGNPPQDIMPEFWLGKLKDSHGRVVTDEKQARAILLSELRALGRIPARKNPSEADELYRKFHGRGPDKIRTMLVKGIDPYGGHPELTQLGPLVRFIVGEGVELGGDSGDVVTAADWVNEISFVPMAQYRRLTEQLDPKDGEALRKFKIWLRSVGAPDVAAVPNTRQLYIVGGNQRLDPKRLIELGADPEKDLCDLGNAYLIEYFAQKRFDRFEPTTYFHRLGEKTGLTPRLIFDRVHSLLQLVGGEYYVTAAGIEN